MYSMQAEQVQHSSENAQDFFLATSLAYPWKQRSGLHGSFADAMPMQILVL